MTKLATIYLSLFLIVHVSGAEITPNRYGETEIPLERSTSYTYTQALVEAEGSTETKPKYKELTFKLSAYGSESLYRSYCVKDGYDNIKDIKIDPKMNPDPANPHKVTFIRGDIKGFPASAKIKVDPNWSLSSLYVTEKCEDGKFNDYNSYGDGTLALGYKGEAANHWKGDNKAFGLRFYSKWEMGKPGAHLFLKPNVSEALRGPVLGKIKTDGDWVAKVSNVALGEKSYPQSDTNLAFDIESKDGIQLPKSLYEQIVEELVKTHNFIKVVDYYRFEGDISTLPKISFTTGDEDEKHVWTLNPKDYVEESSMKKHTWFLTLKPNERKPDDHFVNYIIMGRKCFGDYYVAFDTSKGLVTFQGAEDLVAKAEEEARKKHEEEEEARKEKEQREKYREEAEAFRRKLFWGLGIAIVLVILLVAALCIYKRKQASNLHRELNNNSYQVAA